MVCLDTAKPAASRIGRTKLVPFAAAQPAFGAICSSASQASIADVVAKFRRYCFSACLHQQNAPFSAAEGAPRLRPAKMAWLVLIILG